MSYRRVIASLTLLGAMAALAGSPEPVEAKGKVKDCNDEATRNLLAAKKFFIDNLQTFQNDFELNERDKKERRIHDRMRTKIAGVKFSCAEKVLCRDEQDERSGFHGSGILGNKIRICWHRVKEQKKKFCDVAGLVAHEFGHAVGIPKERGGKHNREHNDKVYQFGFFATQLCQHKGLDRELEDPHITKPTPWTPASTGLAIYPRKNYAGWSITLNGSYPDLRLMGRNNAISSIRVKSGRWQLCTKKNFGGKCKIWTADDPDLSKSKFDNTVASIRPAP